MGFIRGTPLPSLPPPLLPLPLPFLQKPSKSQSCTHPSESPPSSSPDLTGLNSRPKPPAARPVSTACGCGGVGSASSAVETEALPSSLPESCSLPASLGSAAPLLLAASLSSSLPSAPPPEATTDQQIKHSGYDPLIQGITAKYGRQHV